jgi:rhodanese-related sulfurtransferase
MSSISRAQLKEMMELGEDFRLIDVLPPDSFAKHHLPGAINLPLETITAAKSRFDCDDTLVVYCASLESFEARQAAHTLEKMGYDNVWVYDGGLREWLENDQPIERNFAATEALIKPPDLRPPFL